MKKSIIATGAASLALAAMPIVGVFADTYTSSVTDTLTVNIPESCTIENQYTTFSDQSVPSSENTYTVTMKNGQTRDNIGGSAADGGTHDNTFDVSCNVQSDGDATWKLTAVGKGGVTNLVGSGTAAGENIATGTSGGTSYWAFKVAGEGVNGGDVTRATDYATDTFYAVPGTAVTIMTGDGEATLTTTYKVFVDTTQAPGTYTGGVTYTLTNPA